MTFDELEKAIGFHDAFLRAVSVDYIQRTAVMELEVCVGRWDANDRQDREAYRRVRLQFSGLLLFASDVANGEFLEEESPGQTTGLSLYGAYPGDGESARARENWPAEPLPEGAFGRSFLFAGDANSFLHVAAQDVEWTWLSDPRTIY